MNIEKFLEFWTHHNRFIIELIFGFIFVLILFLIYRQFFSSEVPHRDSSGSLNINTAEIEEKLQKIMESQLNLNGQVNNLGSGSSSSVISNEATADLAPLKQEIEKLRDQLKIKDLKIEELAKAGADAKAQSSSAVSKEEKTVFEHKIKELEGRLQEYEIISEDIADLSFYKEENSRLQKEITEIKGGMGAKVANSPSPEPAKPVAKAAPPPPEPEPPAQPAEPEPVASQEPSPAADANAPGPIDDDIMKEFAAAIQDQKSTASGGAVTPENDKLKESQKLMGEFESFLKKG